MLTVDMKNRIIRRACILAGFRVCQPRQGQWDGFISNQDIVLRLMRDKTIKIALSEFQLKDRSPRYVITCNV